MSETEYFDETPVDTRDGLPPNTGKVLIGVAVVALLIAGWNAVGWLRGSIFSSDLHVYLEGNHVDQLQPGARVVIGSLAVGEVSEVETRDGAAVARLRIDGEQASQIATSARFQVDSLNHWMPGNTGVRVYPAAAEPNQRKLAAGDRLVASEKTLPPMVPIRFYGLVAGCALVLAATMVVAKQFAKWLISLTVIATGMLVIAAVVLYLGNVVTLP